MFCLSKAVTSLVFFDPCLYRSFCFSYVRRFTCVRYEVHFYALISGKNLIAASKIATSFGFVTKVPYFASKEILSSDKSHMLPRTNFMFFFGSSKLLLVVISAPLLLFLMPLNDMASILSQFVRGS